MKADTKNKFGINHRLRRRIRLAISDYPLQAHLDTDIQTNNLCNKIDQMVDHIAAQVIWEYHISDRPKPTKSVPNSRNR